MLGARAKNRKGVVVDRSPSLEALPHARLRRSPFAPPDLRRRRRGRRLRRLRADARRAARRRRPRNVRRPPLATLRRDLGRRGRRRLGLDARLANVLDHVTIGVRDLEASRAFYDAALAPLEIPVSRGDEFYEWGGFSISRAEGRAVTRRAHIAFAARSRAHVDAFHRAALAAGGAD